jgi:Tol biopolymer transport system component
MAAIRIFCAAVVVFASPLLAACRESPAPSEERIIFSSNRSPARGRHLWTISPSGDPTTLQQLTTGDQVDGDPRVSPDGTLVAFGRISPTGAVPSSIWVRSLVMGAETRITDDESAIDTMPFWSPDGTILGFLRAHIDASGAKWSLPRPWTVTLVRADDSVRAGRPSLLADMPVLSASWNPITRADLLLMRQEPDGWAPFSIVRLPYPPGAPPVVVIPYDGRGHYTPVSSPDGLRFAFVRYRREIDRGELYVANADGSHETRVACEPGWILPAWSPDGTEIVVVRTNGPGLWRFGVPPAGGSCSGGVQVTRGAFEDHSATWAIIPRRR